MGYEEEIYTIYTYIYTQTDTHTHTHTQQHYFAIYNLNKLLRWC